MLALVRSDANATFILISPSPLPVFISHDMEESRIEDRARQRSSTACDACRVRKVKVRVLGDLFWDLVCLTLPVRHSRRRVKMLNVH